MPHSIPRPTSTPRPTPGPLSLAPIFALLILPFAALAQAPGHGIDTASMDHSVKPGDDFYHYANGTFLKQLHIPADRSSLSTFSVLADQALARSTAIITDPALAAAPAGSDDRKIADLYHAYMDTAAIEAHGRAGLDAVLKPILAIHNPYTLAEALGGSVRTDVDALNLGVFHTDNLFGLWIAPGFSDPDHYAPYILQGGLGLPGRDYYLSSSPTMATIRAAYRKHLTANFRLAGFDQPELRATRVYDLEHAIAEHQISLAESENIEHANNPWTLADFAAKAPGLDWPTFFAAARLFQQKSFIVWQPSAIIAESALVASTPMDAWKDLLIAHVLNDYATGISQQFAEEKFSFTKLLSGAAQQRPREQRAVLLVNSVLGDAVGKLYAARYFTPQEKAQVQALVANLVIAFHARLQDITWMAPATKAEAIAKLTTLRVGIGYPDTWRSYAGLIILPDDLFGDLWRDSLFNTSYHLSQIGQVVARDEWAMTPQTVNAVNLPLDNGLNFPAAILQPPFYDPAAPAAVNYGAIGAVIGHEISHTFDSEGAAFDSQGRVRNWWTEADRKHFDASTAALAAQYDTYKPFPDLAVNGKQTLGENIADVAGLTAAYDAFHASLHGHPAPVVDGLTGDQQFFLAFARNYAGITRDPALRSQLLGDGHAPGQYRALTVRNLDPWYKAFNIQPGDKLYLAPADRVHIW